MPDNVLDLDVLRPKPRNVRIGGKVIDVSFVPCGITFDVDELVSKLRDVVAVIEDETGLKGEAAALGSGNSEGTHEAFDIGVKLCAVFASVQYPEMDEDWFMANTSPVQVGGFSEAIQEALLSSFAGVEAHQKKAPAAKGKKN
mgnify:FL=1